MQTQKRNQPRPNLTAKYETVTDEPDDIIRISTSALKEAATFGMYEPTVYDPIKGTITIPIDGGHYEAIHGLCAALNQDEGEIFQRILEDGIEAGMMGHMHPDIWEAFQALYFKASEGRWPYVLTWAKQRTEELAAKKEG